MPSLSYTIRFLLGAALAFSGFACSMIGRGMPTQPRETNETLGRETAFEENRDLCLFGQTSSVRELTFEGRATIDIRQHTFDGDGLDFDPDVDPTGKRLVFASTRHARHSHLYIKPVGGAVLTQVTDGPASDAQPSFSPTGERIAFTSDRGGQWDIWIIDTNGRNPIQITNNPSAELHPSWSPDGKRLVYCRLNPQDNLGELWVVDLENPGVKRLIGEGLFPEWSPTGDKIAYQRSRARGSRWFSIWTLSIENDDVLFPTEIANRRDAALIAPTWSPDGTQLAFTCVVPAAGSGELRITGTGRSDIGIVDADGRGLQRLTNGRGENYSPSWGPDGRIYFTAKLASTETIWSVKAFRPAMVTEPAATSGDRRAASVVDEDFEH